MVVREHDAIKDGQRLTRAHVRIVSSRQYRNIEAPFNKLFRDSDSTWAMVARQITTPLRCFSRAYAYPVPYPEGTRSTRIR